MARGAVYVVLSSAVLLLALAQATDITLPNGVTAASLNEPTESDSEQGDQPTVTKPDEIFTGSLNPGDSSDTYVGTLTAGADEGKPDVGLDTPYGSGSTEGGSGRKFMRKMLESDLHLYGDGVSAGDQDAGVAANAYGQGQLSSTSDSHIEPHGVQTEVSLGGQQYTTNTGVNPDGLAKEGPVVEAGRK